MTDVLIGSETLNCYIRIGHNWHNVELYSFMTLKEEVKIVDLASGMQIALEGSAGCDVGQLKQFTAALEQFERTREGEIVSPIFGGEFGGCSMRLRFTATDRLGHLAAGMWLQYERTQREFDVIFSIEPDQLPSIVDGFRQLHQIAGGG